MNEVREKERDGEKYTNTEIISYGTRREREKGGIGRERVRGGRWRGHVEGRGGRWNEERIVLAKGLQKHHEG